MGNMAAQQTYNSITLDGLVSVLENRAGSRRSYGDTAKGARIAVLLGAGASKSAGIPLADEFVAEIRRRFPEVVQGIEPKYAEYMARLAPADRVNLLREFIDRAKVNAAHLYLAHLVKQGRIDRILTTNFDSLALQALVLVNERPSVYDLANMRLFKPGQVTSPAIIHLHGQLGGFVNLSTKDEFNSLGNLVDDVLRDTLADRALIVVGYGGRNDPVFRRLCVYGEQYGGYHNGLYWVSSQNTDPPEHVRDLLLHDPARMAFYLRNYDADSFFMELASRLQEGSPLIVERAFTFLLQAIEKIGAFSLEEGGENRIDATRRQVGYAIACHENGAMCARGTAQWAERARVSIVKRAEVIQNGGPINEEQFEGVLADAVENDVPEARRLLARALMIDGNRLAREATQLPKDGERFAKAMEAEARYERAIVIWPDLVEARCSCAAVQVFLAEHATDERANEFFLKARRHYAEVAAWVDKLSYQGFRVADDGISEVALDPLVPPFIVAAYRKWGDALTTLAGRRDPEETESLLAEAASRRRFAEALSSRAPSM